MTTIATVVQYPKESIIVMTSKTLKENNVKIVSEPNLKFENNTKRKT